MGRGSPRRGSRRKRLKITVHTKTHNTKSRCTNPSNTNTKPPKISVPSFRQILVCNLTNVSTSNNRNQQGLRHYTVHPVAVDYIHCCSHEQRTISTTILDLIPNMKIFSKKSSSHRDKYAASEGLGGLKEDAFSNVPSAATLFSHIVLRIVEQTSAQISFVESTQIYHDFFSPYHFIFSLFTKHMLRVRWKTRHPKMRRDGANIAVTTG